MSISSQHPPPLPRPVIVRVAAFLTLGFLLMNVIFAFPNFTARLGLLRGFLIFGLLGGALFTLMFFIRRSWRRLARRAHAENFRLCPSCTNHFGTTGPVHTCEWCSRKINTFNARDRWRRVALQTLPDTLGPMPQRGRSVISQPMCIGALVLLQLVIPLSQVIGAYGTTSAKTVYVPLVITSNSGNPVTIQQPRQVAPSPLEKAIGYSTLYAPLPAILGLGGFLLLRARKSSLATKTARSHNLLVCERCLYPLDTCPETGNCPECGTPYEGQSLRGRWFQAIARKEIHEAYKSGEIDEFLPLEPNETITLSSP